MSLSTLYSRNWISVITTLAIVLWIASHGFHKSTEITEPGTTKLPRNAFATILTSNPGKGPESPDVEEHYLQAARLLSFQLLRNPHVPQRDRDILSREGARVIPLQDHEAGWASRPPSLNKMLARLNLWKLEQYQKVAFLDVETVVLRPLDGIFEDFTTTMRTTIDPASKLPKKYIMAARTDSLMDPNSQVQSNQDQIWPQKRHMNTGFFILHPSKDLFEYYMSLVPMLDTDDSNHFEDDILDYAHREDGPMPRQVLGSEWNLNDASQSDYEKGLKSITRQWWRPVENSFVESLIAMSLDEMTAYLNH
ncbi:unnamed protein product [Penicillium bialowiezense]